MSTLDYSVRLFILCTFLLTAIACFARALRSDEQRAVVGNFAFGAVTAVGVYAQIPMRSVPIGTTDWLRVVACCACLLYLATLARKGL